MLARWTHQATSAASRSRRCAMFYGVLLSRHGRGVIRTAWGRCGEDVGNSCAQYYTSSAVAVHGAVANDGDGGGCRRNAHDYGIRFPDNHLRPPRPVNVCRRRASCVRSLGARVGQLAAKWRLRESERHTDGMSRTLSTGREASGAARGDQPLAGESRRAVPLHPLARRGGEAIFSSQTMFSPVPLPRKWISEGCW
jgi:hypothetical protein